MDILRKMEEVGKKHNVDEQLIISSNQHQENIRRNQPAYP